MLARIVRKAPEVVVKVTGRQRGGSHIKAHLDYIGRKGDVEIETRDGEILTAKEDIAERVAEWSDTLQWRRSEEHTSELQSLMRRSSAVFCLTTTTKTTHTTSYTSVHHSQYNEDNT